MNILLLTDDYLPSTKSAALMMAQLARALVRQGHAVTVATPRNQSEKISCETAETGLKVIQFRSGAFKNVNKFLRCLNESLFSCRLLLRTGKELKRQKIDLIVTYSPSIFWGPAVWYLKHRHHCRTYLIVRDIFPQWVIDSGNLGRYSPITAYFRFFEWLNYLVADRIGVQMPGNLAYFSNRKLRNKTEVLYNWFDTTVPLQQGSGLRERLGWQDKVIFFFGGNLGQAQDMGNLLRLAARMKQHPKARFLLVGNGDEFEMLQTVRKSQKLDNLILLPPVPQKEYFRLLSQIDIGLFTLHPAHKTQNFPGKLLGYMAYSKPILGSVNAGNDILDILEEAQAGLVSVNPDDDAFAANAICLLNDIEKRQRMGKSGRQLLEKSFSVSSAAEHLA